LAPPDVARIFLDAGLAEEPIAVPDALPEEAAETLRILDPDVDVRVALAAAAASGLPADTLLATLRPLSAFVDLPEPPST
jgi:hypothetical protein